MYKVIVCDKAIGSDYLMKYWLLEDENFFGVFLELFDLEGNLKTEHCIKKITQSKSVALNLIRLLAEKDVTPISFPYVFDKLFEIAKNQ